MPIFGNKPDIRNSAKHTHALLSRNAPASTEWVRDPALEEVRQAMISSLAGLIGCEVARMGIRLRYASDIEALWYLRHDLFCTLSLLEANACATATMQPALPVYG